MDKNSRGRMTSVLKKLFAVILFLMCCTPIFYLCSSFMGYKMRNLTTYLGIKVGQLTNMSSFHPSNALKALKISSVLGRTSNYRPDVCKGCFKNSFEILLENKNICKTRPGEELDLIIIIFTYRKSIKQREVIRKTWTQHTKKNTGNSRYFFAFGNYPMHKVNIELAKEATEHGDIVQADFVESYYNLTYKTITMLGWVAKNCPNAKNVMKTDDDMWVNVPEIVQRFKHEPLSKTVAGFCMLNARPIRSKESKWYASLENYHRDMYPDFCSGTGYVMDMGTAIKIHNTSVDVPFLYLEDVYVALCLEHLGKDYHVRPTDGFNNGKYSMSNLCSFKKFVLTSHYMTPKDIEQIWDATC